MCRAALRYRLDGLPHAGVGWGEGFNGKCNSLGPTPVTMFLHPRTQFEASRAIRALADPVRSRVPIVAVSASALPSDVDRSLAAGMDAHLSKPIDSATLASCVLHWTTERPL
jgi:hypothetical protein